MENVSKQKENPHEILFSYMVCLICFPLPCSVNAVEVFLYFFFLTGIQISLL